MATTSVPAMIAFFLEKSKRDRLEKKVDGNLNLATAIDKDLQYPIQNCILLAKLKGHEHDEAAVSPVLLCKWLQENSVVRIIRKENANPFREIPEAVEKQCIFYLRTTERRNKEAMTDTRYTLYEGKDLCVVAFNEETLEEALRKDKRLTNVERFKLYRDNDRQSGVSLDDKACKYKNYVFNVSVMPKTAKKRKVSTSSENGSGLLIKKEDTEEEQDDCIIVFPSFSASLKDSFSDEIAAHMIKQAQDEARRTLISQNRRNNATSLVNSVSKFAKKVPTARPARTLAILASYVESVGCLMCGSVQGTCFLVNDNLVMTSHHIINMIIEARQNATDENNRHAHATISIYFDYLVAGQILDHRNLLRVEVDETKYFGNSHLDYVFLELKENNVLRERTPLGPIVRNTIPESGTVTIIGHPNGGELLEDACRIICRNPSNIPGVLDTRAIKKEVGCVKDPMSCSIHNDFAKCVHMYIGRSIEHHSNHLSYDTTLFHGSSGSPVFNADGHLIAIHTQGYPINNNRGGLTSIMEFGVTFAAIFEDVKSREGEQIANNLFPRIFDNFFLSDKS